MKTNLRSFTYLSFGVALLGLSGCSCRVKPDGFSPMKVEQTLNNLRYDAQFIHQGNQVRLLFYPGTPDFPATNPEQGVVGYFVAYNKMSDMIFISQKPPSIFDRGTPYDLRGIHAILPADQAIPDALKLVEKPKNLQPDPTAAKHDYQRELLTQ